MTPNDLNVFIECKNLYSKSWFGRLDLEFGKKTLIIEEQFALKNDFSSHLDKWNKSFYSFSQYLILWGVLQSIWATVITLKLLEETLSEDRSTKTTQFIPQCKLFFVMNLRRIMTSDAENVEFLN